MVFRNADGSALAADTKVSVQGPANYNAGAALSFTTYAGTTLGDYDWYSGDTPAIVSGSYTVTTTVAGVTYRKTFNIDASSVLAIPSAVSVNQAASGYTASGTLPAGAADLNVVIYSDTSTVRFSRDLTSLPANGMWATPVPKGTYFTGVYAGSFTGASGGVLPDQINRSFADTPDFVVP